MERDRRTQNLPGSSVIEVITRDIVPGRERDFEEWAHRIVSTAARDAGHRHPPHRLNSGPRYAHTSGFCSALPCNEEAAPGPGEESEERNRLVQEAGEFSTPNLQRATGLETWFAPPGEPAIAPRPRAGRC